MTVLISFLVYLIIDIYTDETSPFSLSSLLHCLSPLGQLQTLVLMVILDRPFEDVALAAAAVQPVQDDHDDHLDQQRDSQCDITLHSLKSLELVLFIK